MGKNLEKIFASRRKIVDFSGCKIKNFASYDFRRWRKTEGFPEPQNHRFCRPQTLSKSMILTHRKSTIFESSVF